jgi:polar amino acid transport system substrate-binding protein
MSRGKLVLRALFATCVALALFASGGTSLAGSLDDVKARGKIIAGVRYDTAPYGYLDPGGKVVGLDIDLITEVAKRLGVSVEFVQVTAKTRIPLLESGKVDILAAALTHTRERDQVIDYSITYLVDGSKLLVKKGSGIRRIEDLNKKGKTIACIQGSMDEVNARRLAPEARVLNYQEYPQAFLAVKQGLADAMTTVVSTLDNFVKQDDSTEVVGDFLNTQPIAFGVRQNDSPWRDAINWALQDMVQDGTYKTIYMKHFKTPYQQPPETWPRS